MVPYWRDAWRFGWPDALDSTGAPSVERPAASLNVLQVSYTDLEGRRFNGYDLLADLKPYGVKGSQAVLAKLSRNPNVFSLWSGPIDKRVQDGSSTWRSAVP